MMLIGVAVMLLALGALVFAAVVGSWPERCGAAVIFLGAIATQSLQLAVGLEPPIWAVMTVDMVQGLALFAILLKSKRFWAGIATVAQMLVIVFTVVRYFNFPLAGAAYLIVLNISGWIPIIALLGGAVAHRWGPKASDEELAWAH